MTGHPTAYPSPNPALEDSRAARDAGMAAAEAGQSAAADRAVIDAAIEYLAGTGDVFSANDVRPLLPSVAPALIGSRFLAASRAGLIVRDGTTQASHEEGHARLLSTWAGSKPEARPKQTPSTLLPGDGKVPSQLTPAGEQAMRRAEWALAGGSGKGGIKTVADARGLIRELLDTLSGLTGAGPSSSGSLF